MSAIVVRRARPEDLDAMAAIEAAQPTSAGWTKTQFAAELDRENALVLFCELGGRPAGHLAAWFVGAEAQLFTVTVDPGQARRGVGSALMEELKVAARARGCAKITLELSERNTTAMVLYAREGGRVVGRRPKFYNDGADALLMDLPL